MAMFVFPGQGSQQPGMGKFLFDNFQSAKQVYDEGSEVLNLNLEKLCFTGSESELALTANTQPALLATSTATQRVLIQEFNISMKAGAGHSIGEYAALVAANVLPYADALRAVRIRGEAMQSAVPVGRGGMAAVLGLESAQVEELCKYAVENSQQGPLSPANFNSPGQIVISGAVAAIEWLKTSFKPESLWGTNAPKRIKVIPLQVSAPFHCAMMAPAEEKMREVLTKISFQDSKIPIFQNFTAAVETKALSLRENLIRQVSAPVRWQQSMQIAKQQGFLKVIECGSGKVLQGLLKKIDPEFQVFTTNSVDELKEIERISKELNS
jgi:[acyl-carrier-protein] S-malonyltransferase